MKAEFGSVARVKGSVLAGKVNAVENKRLNSPSIKTKVSKLRAN